MGKDGIIINVPGESASFRFKEEITSKTENNGTEDVE